jgi:hypothetical protein
MIVNRWCEHKANELTNAYELVHDLRRQLLSVTSVWTTIDGNAVSIPVSDTVRTALRRSDVRPDIDPLLKTRVADWIDALRDCATATL